MLSLQIRHHLLTNGPTTANQVCAALKITQSTFSRQIKSIKPDIHIIGATKNTQYALKREVFNLGSSLPMFYLQQNGETIHAADLLFIKPRGIYVKANLKTVNSKYYQMLPYFLDDLRPAGFLGRLIPKKHPELGFNTDIKNWGEDTCIMYFTMLGWDLIGNILIGEKALALFNHKKQSQEFLVNRSQREVTYNKLAEEVILLGAAGSSAAGEQPKFLAVVKSDNILMPVLVKFSPICDSPVQKRRRELLEAEYIALTVLREKNKLAAEAELIKTPQRVFLETKRFDRLGMTGRYGVISLAALDNEFAGSGGTWRDIAKQLLELKIIDKKIYAEILFFYYFGICIHNTEMHSGNLSLYVEGERVIGLAPIYDMLPMAYAPVFEEVRVGEVQVPEVMVPPQESGVYAEAKRIADIFWGRCCEAGVEFWQKGRD